VKTASHVLPRPLPTSFAFKGHRLKIYIIKTNIKEYIVKEKKRQLLTIGDLNAH